MASVMIWLLLFALTALVVLLPMLPAIVEWRWPSDVVPLHIETQDALEPAFLAQAFAARLQAAVADAARQLDAAPIVTAPSTGAWPLDAAERRSHRSKRIWRAAGDAQLPAEQIFLGEVAADRNLCTARSGVYWALWAGQQLDLAPYSTVLRWAHGKRVDVAAGCRLQGRVSADESIRLWGGAAFTLLHAPAVIFVPEDDGKLPTPPAASAFDTTGLPESVVWDATASHARCTPPLVVNAHRGWRGDLVCQGALALGAGCQAEGSLKAHGDITAAAGCSITGSVFSEGSIDLGAYCTVQGSVVAETAIVLGAGCVVGAPGHPATVAAPRIEVAAGVVVHGTVWAGDHGRADADAQAGWQVAPGGFTQPPRPALPLAGVAV